MPPSAPPPALPRLENWSPLIGADGVFSPEECTAVETLAGETKAGGIAQPDEGAAYRKSNVSWLRPGPDIDWIFERAREFVIKVNAHAYRMELAGFTEPLQVAEYGEGQYYDWHLDVGADRLSIRKLSFIVQLTDPADYEGGLVELLYSREAKAIPKQRGAMAVFPSYLLHRVNPVTQGMRKSLVGWIGGPHYR